MQKEEKYFEETAKFEHQIVLSLIELRDRAEKYDSILKKMEEKMREWNNSPLGQEHPFNSIN